MSSYVLSLLFSLMVALSVHSQTPAPSPEVDLPTSPFINRAPEFSQWQVTAIQKKRPEPTPNPESPASGNSPAPTVPDKVFAKSVITKTGKIMRELRSYTDGSKSENWYANGFILREHPTGKFISVIDPRSDRAAGQAITVDFDGLNWLDAQHFWRSETKRGAKCYAYSWKERAPTQTDLAGRPNYAAQAALYEQFVGKPKVPTVVWIEKVSRLPVAVENENASYTYDYQDPPTEALTLPPAFQKEWDRYKAVLDDWKQHVMPKQR